MALRLSGQDELREEVAALLETHGLPLHIEDDVDLEAVELATARDKKRRGEAPVRFVLVQAPGNVSHGHTVEPDALRAALKELAS